jgi:hypothetical protein
MLARTGHTLRVLNDDDIKNVLRYAMVLVGLRSNNMPSLEEKYVLLNFIKSNFGNVTLEEMKMAFDFAVAGKLGIDAKCYENFSCEYVGRILSTFLNFSKQETLVLSQKVTESDPLPVPSDNELKKQCIETVNMYVDLVDRLGAKFHFKAGGLNYLYDVCEKFEIIKLSIDEKKRIMGKFEKLNKPKEEIKQICKAEAYKEFIYSLAEMGCLVDSNGTIKQKSI